jgi:hypothetical protein
MFLLQFDGLPGLCDKVVEPCRCLLQVANDTLLFTEGGQLCGHPLFAKRHYSCKAKRDALTEFSGVCKAR